MKEIVKNQLALKESIPEHLDFKLSTLGFLTGSTVFGGVTKDSDIDIVLKYNNQLINELKDYLVPSCNYEFNKARFFSCYIKIHEKIFNLLFFKKDIDYTAWKKANKLLINLLKGNEELQELIKDKKFRVELFTLLRNNYGFVESIDENPVAISCK